MLRIRTRSGVEICLPVDDIESITEVERASGEEKTIPQHPYLERDGGNRCVACWRDRLHPSHADVAPVLT